jgi:hypothetical protein
VGKLGRETLDFTLVPYDEYFKGRGPGSCTHKVNTQNKVQKLPETTKSVTDYPFFKHAEHPYKSSQACALILPSTIHKFISYSFLISR